MLGRKIWAHAAQLMEVRMICGRAEAECIIGLQARDNDNTTNTSLLTINAINMLYYFQMVIAKNDYRYRSALPLIRSTARARPDRPRVPRQRRARQPTCCRPYSCGLRLACLQFAGWWKCHDIGFRESRLRFDRLCSFM